MLTKAIYQSVSPNAEVPLNQETPPAVVIEPTEYKKGWVVIVRGIEKIVMAKLQADHVNPVTYSICDKDFRNPEYGVSLIGVDVVPPEALSEEIRRRAMSFA